MELIYAQCENLVRLFILHLVRNCQILYYDDVMTIVCARAMELATVILHTMATAYSSSVFVGSCRQPCSSPVDGLQILL